MSRTKKIKGTKLKKIPPGSYTATMDKLKIAPNGALLMTFKNIKKVKEQA